MQTGYNGCGWVCMGALGCRGHGAHKNKASRGYLGPKRAGFGFYGRGNFPGHHVFSDQAKSGTDARRWILCGLHGCE